MKNHFNVQFCKNYRPSYKEKRPNFNYIMKVSFSDGYIEKVAYNWYLINFFFKIEHRCSKSQNHSEPPMSERVSI